MSMTTRSLGSVLSKAMEKTMDKIALSKTIPVMVSTADTTYKMPSTFLCPSSLIESITRNFQKVSKIDTRILTMRRREKFTGFKSSISDCFAQSALLYENRFKGHSPEAFDLAVDIMISVGKLDVLHFCAGLNGF